VRSVTVTSSGQIPLRPRAGSITGADATQFAVESDTCADAVLAPGDSCTLTVRFAPTVPGQAGATLRIPSNDPRSPRTVDLTGTGVANVTPPAPEPAPTNPPAPAVCTMPPTPEAMPGGIRVSRSQLVTDQRIAIAAIRRAHALSARMRAGSVAENSGRPVEAAPIRMNAAQLRINQRIAQTAVRRANEVAARLEGRPVPVAPEPRAGQMRLSAAQLRINQRISITALQRVAAIDRCLESTGR
jgi:hypothetical protein